VRAVPPPGEIEHDVLATFSAPWAGTGKSTKGRPERWKAIPAGARIIGTWDFRQPETGKTYRISIDDELWSIPSHLVTLSCFVTKRASPRAQFEIAQESLRAAAELEVKQDRESSLEAYACAVLELAISGAPAADLAPARLCYARLLLQAEQVERAREEMQLAVGSFERAVSESAPA
jgi:hypothetical protein